MSAKAAGDDLLYFHQKTITTGSGRHANTIKKTSLRIYGTH
ncbi:hypothetical protein B194_0151 [Serratia plymuthica A30]|nr:hypothetical protein B194_0151 [Serratia plymuthica A30]